VASGQSMLDPRAASQLMARLRDRSVRRDPLAGLSAQERKILELIGEGLTNRQIGERMFLAEKTVKNYVSALFAELGMERRTQAAAYAVRVFGDHHEDKRGGYHAALVSVTWRVSGWRQVRPRSIRPADLSVPSRTRQGYRRKARTALWTGPTGGPPRSSARC
jgi:DNA-binding CsgD family transcriptional regulator